MKINPFEGARRTVRFVQVLWVLIVSVVVWMDTPYATATYITTGPNEPFVKAPQEFTCGYSNDASEHEYRTTSKGTHVSVTLCFQSMSFPDGRKLVLYKVTDGQWWGDQ